MPEHTWFIISKTTSLGRQANIVAIQGFTAAETELKFWRGMSWGSRYQSTAASLTDADHVRLITLAKDLAASML